MNRRTTLALFALATVPLAGAAGAGPPPSPALHLAAALLTIAAVGVMVARRLDVRLALVLGAIPLYLLAGGLQGMLVVFAREMANAKTVVPILSALGFAHVLRLTECDRHLVAWLLKPLRRVRPLLIPGGVAAGYVVNSAIVSQTGTAAVIGPILIPLLRAGGVGAETAGAVLLLGSSMGGELFNPGAVEMATLARLTGLENTAVVERTIPLNLLASLVGLLSFWWLAVRHERRSWAEAAKTSEEIGRAVGSPAGKEPELPRVIPVKAVVPLLPLVLLFAAPDRINPPRPGAGDEGHVTILAAMLVGCAAAVATAPRLTGRAASAFFEGAGYAYTHVISLIVAAGVFAEAIRGTPLVGRLAAAMAGRPAAAQGMCLALPLGLAVVAGTGIGSAVAVMETLVPSAEALGLDPVRIGALASIGAHFGRTMSPAAAVVAMSATLSGARISTLARRVAPPLLLGAAALLAAALLGLV